MTYVANFGLIKDFIKITNDILELPTLNDKKFHKVAKDLGEISKKLFDANQKILLSLHSFRNYGFPDLTTKYTESVVQYQASKNSNFHEWKASCNDISLIYNKPDSNMKKLATKLFDTDKQKQLTQILSDLAGSDIAMIDLVKSQVADAIGNYIDTVEVLRNQKDYENAEKTRLEFVRDTKEIVTLLDNFSSDLSNLVIKFSNIAQAPITV